MEQCSGPQRKWMMMMMLNYDYDDDDQKVTDDDTGENVGGRTVTLITGTGCQHESIRQP